MRRVFPSLKDPEKYGYAFDTDCYDHKAFFSEKFRMFETYGDGLIQHSRDWAVAIDNLADYLASLATAMLKDEELTAYARWQVLGGEPQREAIEFAASVKFKAASETAGYEKTARYFSVSERKISSSASKQYDNRYQRVEPWCDGSVEAIYRMLVPEFARGMEFYGYADAIRNWCLDCSAKDRPPFYGLTAQFLKWFEGDAHKARELRYAWNACKHLFEALNARCEAETMLKNLHWPPAKAEEETAA